MQFCAIPTSKIGTKKKNSLDTYHLQPFCEEYWLFLGIVALHIPLIGLLLNPELEGIS